MNTLVIVFGSIIVIVGMVLTYQLLTMIIDKKNGGHKRHRNCNSQAPDAQAWHELAERAEALNQRLQNLEEILNQEKEKENVP